MSLVSLPIELLDMICHRIYDFQTGIVHDDETKAVYTLCLTSKHLYTASKPHLYRRIHTRRVYLLARSIANSPSLALLTKELHLMLGPDQKYDTGKAYTLLKSRGFVPGSCTRHLHPADQPLISLMLCEALLTKMCNVSELSLCIDKIPTHIQLFDPKRWRSKKKDSLPLLTDLTLFQSYRCIQDPGLIRHMQYLLPLLALRKVYIEMNCVCDVPETGLALSTLEKLDISCGISRADMELLVHGCHALRSFSYSHMAQSDPRVNMRDVLDTLQSQRNTLAHLSIHFHHDDCYEEDINDEDILQQLHNYAHLEHLDVDFDSLLDLDSGWDNDYDPDLVYREARFVGKLPHHRVIKELEEVAKCKVQDLPYLDTVTLEFFEEVLGGIGDDDQGNEGCLCDGLDLPLTEAKKALANAGVRLLME
ncbi:hypothetical protein LTR70_010407 [Exophiala xenobiotica]|uniref:F-box domain-containing protein n=1 Tax=Lithohypha guttulata TaxID=1690604 RepID=A0ABR0JU49_9EURO|nr:hypothetical protein LTR24_010358 [Lithohypha guttulata]KAK5309312.1 hypothetical protein LTR70_010407 [Exophiala xenobiotica]